MQQIALILVCLLIGIILRWTERMPDSASKVMGAWVINVALPAAALHSLRGIEPTGRWWLAAATPWIGVVLAIVIIVPLSRKFGWSRQRTGALLLAAGFGNTSFVGLPMIAAFAGSQWLGLGIVIDLFGSYFALSTLGLVIATLAASEHFDWRFVVKRIITFPPFIAILIAFATDFLARPAWLDHLFGALADTLTPLALATVGFTLRPRDIAGHVAPLIFGLGFRLLAAPLAILLMYLALGQASDPVSKVAMLEMAMPPMLGASIIAMDHDLEPELVAIMIGIGVPLSLFTAWGWWTLIAPL